jgi:hypothetical protein
MIFRLLCEEEATDRHTNMAVSGGGRIVIGLVVMDRSRV